MQSDHLKSCKCVPEFSLGDTIHTYLLNPENLQLTKIQLLPKSDLVDQWFLLELIKWMWWRVTYKNRMHHQGRCITKPHQIPPKRETCSTLHSLQGACQIEGECPFPVVVWASSKAAQMVFVSFRQLGLFLFLFKSLTCLRMTHQ